MKKTTTIVLQLLSATLAFTTSSIIGSTVEDSEGQNIIGIFADDADYFETLDILMVNAKEEVLHCQEYALTKILPQVENPGHFTDIGPGDGQLTKLVGKHFNEITIIDKSPVALEQFSTGDFSPGSKVSTIQDYVENCKLDELNSDLVLFSHLLYYIERDEWMSLTKRAYSGLNTGGVLAFIFNDSLDRSKLLSHFGGKPFDSESFIKDCVHEFPDANVELFTSVETMHIDNIDNMLKLTGLYLNDAKVTASKENAIKYINYNLKKGNGSYKMNTKQHFLIIKKIRRNEASEKDFVIRTE